MTTTAPPTTRRQRDQASRSRGHRITRHTASPETIGHITALVAGIRPDWDPGLVKIVLHSHAGQVAAEDLAVAAIRAAGNLDLPTPKAIGWRGIHWDGAETLPREVAPRERCGVCGKTEPACYSTRPGVDDDHRFEPVAVTR